MKKLILFLSILSISCTTEEIPQDHVVTCEEVQEYYAGKLRELAKNTKIPNFQSVYNKIVTDREKDFVKYGCK